MDVPISLIFSIDTVPGYVRSQNRIHHWGNLSSGVDPKSDVSGGSKGGAGDACPPGGPNSFNFMQFWEIVAKSYVGVPPGELAPPPRGNPGSATGCNGSGHVL